MAISDLWNGAKYRRQIVELERQLEETVGLNAELHAQVTKLGAMDALAIQSHIQREQENLAGVRETIKSAEGEVQSLNSQIISLRSDVLALEETLLLESFALYEPKFKLTASHEYKTRLVAIREHQKAMIKGGNAATGNMGWTVNGSQTEGRKLVNDMIKLVIRSFNNEADYCVDNVKFDNIELGEKRIRKSYEACNRLGRMMDVRLSETYLDLKLDELRLSYEFQVKKQEEKEEAKRIREELREQQKLEQEIRAARERIAKERKHFSAALRDLRIRLEKPISEEERTLILGKITEVETQNSSLDREETVIDYREKNAKAGYVYVISNIGAFGENIFKIGMTRRLDPMERIDELGDASVPFWFDVHAMVFSDNAPALEAKLHERFSSGRLNKVNLRKEFFRANIAEIEAIIRENFDPSVEVVRECSAEQYRESLRMIEPSDAGRQSTA